MNNLALQDELCDLIVGRLGLRPQNLRREKVQEALDRLVDPDDASVARLHQLDLGANPWQVIVNAATIGETRFLRQRGWFHQIERLVLAPLIKQRRERGERRLRLWSAGCATGEEAYTMAMLIRDLLPDLQDWHVEIVATDISGEALRQAELGVYPARQLRELDPAQASRHFSAVPANRQVVGAELRSMVRFQMANLVDDTIYPVFAGAFDLIICRNVLMYLTAEMQRHVAANLCASLRDGGWLAVAPAEAMADWFRSLTPVSAPEAILFRKGRRELLLEPTKRAEASSVTAIPRAEPSESRPPPLEMPPPRQPVAQATLEEAQRFADRGALEQARAHCNDVLAQDQLNGAACLLLSAICSELGDYPTAYDAVRRAIYLQPTSAEAHFQLAGVLRNLGQAKRADRSMAIAGRLATASVSRSKQ